MCVCLDRRIEGRKRMIKRVDNGEEMRVEKDGNMGLSSHLFPQEEVSPQHFPQDE